MEIHGFHAMQHYAVGPNGDYYSMVSRESVAGVAASSKEEEIALEGTSPCLLFSMALSGQHCPAYAVGRLADSGGGVASSQTRGRRCLCRVRSVG